MNPLPPSHEEMTDDEIDQPWQSRVYGNPFVVTQELKALLAQRLAELRANPDGVIPHEVVMAELRAEAAEHDASFRAKIQEALDDPSPLIPHAEVEAEFAKRRANALAKTKN
jgi:hypothetical protein